jgi:hypothetical protein
MVASTINNYDDLPWRAVATWFPPQDEAIYADPISLLSLGRAACGISLEGQPDTEGIPTPSRIVVAYVEAPGSSALWEVFGHSSWPVPLRFPDWQYPEGRHWRNDVAVSARVIRRALILLENDEADAVRLRLEAQRNDDALLLPGRNFHLPNGQFLIDRFRAFMANAMDIPAVEAGVRTERFIFERLPGFYKNTGGRNKSFAVDERDLVFAHSKSGQHGGQHPLPMGADAEAVQRLLEGRYRFGTPFSQDGFQHDAQWEGDKPLKNERFDCAALGPVSVSGSHANVYPNDLITAHAITKIE